MKINPNDGAFTCAADGMHQPGLTKLEWAAVQIAAGIRSSGEFGWLDLPSDILAQRAVADASALFAELEKQG